MLRLFGTARLAAPIAFSRQLLGPSPAIAVVSGLACRHHSTGHNSHDSTKDPFATQHFDMQDVDADRLTHFYWDRNDDSDGILNPYDHGFMFESMDEYNREGMEWVDVRDLDLLNTEYLQ